MRSNRNERWCRGARLCLTALLVIGPARVSANEVDGFTEPYRTVNVAAVETGTIHSIEVQEGQPVHKGQILARLDDAVFQALLAIADEARQAQGHLKSAEAELSLRQRRLEKLQTLRQEGHARQGEVDRARADLQIAQAALLSAREALQVKQLEYEKIRVQLERRVVRSPLDGIVNIRHKDVGEFVAPNDPYLLELVALDPLMATFSVPRYLVRRLEVDAVVPVYLEEAEEIVNGRVAFISPVTDAESGTVRVKVRIANADGRFRSGERCTLRIPPAPMRARK